MCATANESWCSFGGVALRAIEFTTITVRVTANMNNSIDVSARVLMDRGRYSYRFAGIIGALVFGIFVFLLVLSLYGLWFAISGLVVFVVDAFVICRGVHSKTRNHETFAAAPRSLLLDARTTIR
jgi:tetrahydromethanopterin S-methyltransferase subunit E